MLLFAALIYGLTFWALVGFAGDILVLVIPLLLFCAAGLYFGPEQFDVAATRMLSQNRVRENMPIEVRLTVTNHGARLEEVLIEDFAPRGLHVSGSNAAHDDQTALLVSLGPGETAELAYTVEGPRGYYTFSHIRLTARDRFDLFRRQRYFALPEQPLYVLPNVIRLHRIDIRPRQTRVFAGSIPARVGGPGVEFFGVREYQPADPQRHINWRAHARHPQTLFSNEFEQERIADIGLILDARQRTQVELAGQSLFEYSVGATAALAESFLDAGNRVGFLRYGRFLDRVHPGYGKRQRERILRALARAETGESQVFDKLEYLPTRFFPRKSQIVLISPLCSEDTDFLVYLRGQGYEVLVVSPDPVTFEYRAAAPRPEIDLAYRIATLERVALFRRLCQAGVRVVDWDISQPLEFVLATALTRQPAWSRPMGILV
jgi:uncharacterized protein (DUF58 family)